MECYSEMLIVDSLVKVDYRVNEYLRKNDDTPLSMSVVAEEGKVYIFLLMSRML